MSGVAPAETFTPLTPAPVTGGRRRKLKLVTRKQARKMLKKMGAKMRGGNPTDPVIVDPAATGKNPPPPEEGGRRRRHTKKTHRKSRGRKLFGLRY